MFNARRRSGGGRVTTSGTYAWKSRYPSRITTNSVTPGAVVIRSWDNRGTDDTTLSDNFYKQHTLFGDVRNLSNEPYREKVVDKNFTRSHAINGATIYVGSKGNF